MHLFPGRTPILTSFCAIVAGLGAWAAPPARSGADAALLLSHFSAAPIKVDGMREAAWEEAPMALIEKRAAAESLPDGFKAAIGNIRSLWDGPRLYLLIEVWNGTLPPGGSNPMNTDGVELFLDIHNDKIPKNEEDDCIIRVSRSGQLSGAGPYAERLLAHASAPADFSDRHETGYRVELALAIGDISRQRTASIGADIAVHDSHDSHDSYDVHDSHDPHHSHDTAPSGTRRHSVFWSDTDNRGLDDNSRWGVIRLSGYDGKSPGAPDTHRLDTGIRKAETLPRGVWQDEIPLDRALSVAKKARQAPSSSAVTTAIDTLDRAVQSLRRKGRYPDPFELPEMRHLPDPFAFIGGGRVHAPADWPRRRAEILDLIQYYEFGVLPARPDSVTATAQGDSVTIRIEDNGRSASFAARLSVPSEERCGRRGPYPVIVSIDFWASAGNRILLDAGYAILSIPYSAAASDDTRHTGAFYDLYPYAISAGADVGVLMAWAWGAGRAVDAVEYLVRHSPVHARLLAPNKMAVTGFSRCGKAALLAGVMDDRFGVVNPGASGCGGAAVYRYDSFGNTPYRVPPYGNVYPWGVSTGCEVLGDHVRHQGHNSNEMLSRFLNPGRPYKTHTPGYGERLPYDHHEMIAAIAPRAVIVTAAVDDYANGPEGDSIGLEGARPVYRFLGVERRLAFNLRTAPGSNPRLGGHYVDDAQTKKLAAFLDMVFREEALPEEIASSLYENPYLETYRRYYGGLKTMMPWLDKLPPRARSSLSPVAPD